MWNPASLLQTTPPDTWSGEPVYLTLIALAAALFLTFFVWKRAPGRATLLPIFGWNAVVGPLVWWLRTSGVPVLGMGIWQFVQLILTLAYLVPALVHLRKPPVQESSNPVKDRRNRYLPKGNRR